jgi:hypothetical protein
MADRLRHEWPGSAAGEDRLQALGRDLERQRARARRERRRRDAISHEPSSVDAVETARKWSDTIGGALHSAEAISREPTGDLNGLVVKFDAAWWWIIEDNSLLDDTARL